MSYIKLSNAARAVKRILNHRGCYVYVTTALMIWQLTRRLLVTDPNNILCLRSYWLGHVSQQTPRLAAISHQPPTLLIE
jgi:hypothetical protein